MAIRAHPRAAALLLTATALGLAVAHAVWPEWKIDTITVTLLIVAALPWLGEIFESIDFPGGGSVRFRELEERVEASERNAGEATNTAQAALGAASVGSGQEDADAALHRVRGLAARYLELREAPRGPARSESMSRLFGELMAWTPHAEGFDVEEALDSSDPGMRLAAYAQLYATRDEEHLPHLVRALVEKEDKPFNEYWGIRTAVTLVQQSGGELSLGDAARLRERFAGLPRASDRSMELDRLLHRS
ncbi:hypothetical protein [Streptomyces sp. NPDC051214]|uniref:hypothetical protein n=1 Tax=Streptomyces sp. NPDC051214 TaxID=3155282 RepID=UPI003436C66B